MRNINFNLLVVLILGFMSISGCETEKMIPQQNIIQTESVIDSTNATVTPEQALEVVSTVTPTSTPVTVTPEVAPTVTPTSTPVLNNEIEDPWEIEIEMNEPPIPEQKEKIDEGAVEEKFVTEVEEIPDDLWEIE